MLLAANGFGLNKKRLERTEETLAKPLTVR
jgi:hypothetical protein